MEIELLEEIEETEKRRAYTQNMLDNPTPEPYAKKEAPSTKGLKGKEYNEQNKEEINERARTRRQLIKEGEYEVNKKLSESKNGDRLDNKIDNLELTTQSKHMEEHRGDKGRFAKEKMENKILKAKETVHKGRLFGTINRGGTINIGKFQFEVVGKEGNFRTIQIYEYGLDSTPEKQGWVPTKKEIVKVEVEKKPVKEDIQFKTDTKQKNLW